MYNKCVFEINHTNGVQSMNFHIVNCVSIQKVHCFKMISRLTSEQVIVDSTVRKLLYGLISQELYPYETVLQINTAGCIVHSTKYSNV